MVTFINHNSNLFLKRKSKQKFPPLWWSCSQQWLNDGCWHWLSFFTTKEEKLCPSCFSCLNMKREIHLLFTHVEQLRFTKVLGWEEDICGMWECLCFCAECVTCRFIYLSAGEFCCPQISFPSINWNFSVAVWKDEDPATRTFNFIILRKTRCGFFS